MNKKIMYIVGGVVILGLAYWLISPLWRNVTLDEEFPTVQNEEVKSGMEMMDDATKQEFMEAMTEMEDKVVKMEEKMPATSPSILGQGQLVASAHEVAGKVLLVESGDQKVLRFEDFKSVNGPDLRIYLATDLQASDYVDLGVMRATEGNINYAIPAGTDTTKYKYALVWCRAFSVLFSYAELK